MSKQTIGIIYKNKRRMCNLIGQGTEGWVYRFDNKYVVKIYDSPDKRRIQKINALISLVKSLPDKDRTFLKKHITFPEALIKDSHGMPIGFIMRRVHSDYRPHNEVFYENNVHYENRLRFSCCFAKILNTLHQNKIYIGDFNPRNFLSNLSGDFQMVDADSLDFCYEGIHYKCVAYYPQTLPLDTYSYLIKAGDSYKYNPNASAFNSKTDSFSFAYTVFQLLCGVSPYAAVPADPCEMERRSKKICPIFTKDYDYEIPPSIIRKSYICKSLFSAFKNTFLYNRNVSAEQYLKVLHRNRLLYGINPFIARRRNGEVF